MKLLSWVVVILTTIAILFFVSKGIQGIVTGIGLIAIELLLIQRIEHKKETYG